MLDAVTPEQCRQYRRKGWTRLEGVLDDDQLTVVRRCLDDAEGRTDLQEANRNLGAQSYKADPEYRKMLQQLHNLRFEYPDLAEIALSPRIAGLARDLLGVDHVRLFLDQTFLKPPEAAGTKPTPWHQDLQYFPFDSRDCLAVWIAVEDVVEASGPLAYLPGSHRMGPLGRTPDLLTSDPGVDVFVREEDRELVGDPVEVPLRAGDAAVHNLLTLHRASPNLSDRPRRAWQLMYISDRSLYTGAAHFVTDGLGLEVFQPFDHPRFPVVA